MEGQAGHTQPPLRSSGQTAPTARFCRSTAAHQPSTRYGEPCTGAAERDSEQEGVDCWSRVLNR